MSIKKIILGDEARQLLFSGLDKAASAVATSAGPGGRLTTIQQQWGSPKITKDGISILKSITLQKEEGEGVKLLVQASEKTANVAGDGTTNTCIIARNIAKLGLKYIDKGCKATELKRGIDLAVANVVESLKQHSKEITTNDEIKQIATVSANGDTEIGNFIANAIEKVGKTGVVTVEEAQGMETTLEVVEGMQIEQGYISPYFMTNLEKSLVEFDNPYIFLYDGKITSLKSILPLLEQVSQTGNPLVIFCDEIDDAPLGALIQNHIKGTLRSCVVKAPSYGDIRRAIMEDVATLTGGHFVASMLGNDLEKISIEALGTCSRIRISPKDTVVVSGNGSQEEIAERVKIIQGEIANTDFQYIKVKLEERLARLTSGVAVIRVGAPTEVEMNEKKDRVDDAICATKAALEEGILPGGGVSLIKAREEMPILNDEYSNDFKIGYDIVIQALDAQTRQIAENVGKTPDVVVEKISEMESYSFGFDASTGEFGDMFEKGIVDATKVVRCALENGASVAGSLLAVECLIVDDVDEMLKYSKMVTQQ